MNSWRGFCPVFSNDKIRPHEFMATILSCFFANKIRHYGFITRILSCYFRLQNTSSWIHGDDLVLSFSITKFVIMNSWRRFCPVFSLTKFVIMNSWRWFCPVFFDYKIRPNEFMATILSCLFRLQNSSLWIQGDCFVLFFRWKNSST